MASAESGRPGFIVRPMRPDDIDAVLDIQARAFPGMPGWRASDLAAHLRRFPEGQLVAVDADDRVVGSASALLIDWDDYDDDADWITICGKGDFSTHNPLGRTLYGAEMGVDPDFHRRGIGSLLLAARKELVRRLGLKRLLAGGRIPGYAQVAAETTPQDYVADVVAGRRADPTLTFQLASGLVVRKVVAGYLHDPASRNCATLLEWRNPYYESATSLAAERLHDAAPRPRRRVRLAVVQYRLRPIAGFAAFETQVTAYVRSARAYGCQFVLFPEYLTMQLLSYVREPDPARAVRRLAALTPDYEALFARLAREHGVYIVAGTHPVCEGDAIFNAAHLFSPHGGIHRQKKVHMTRIERLYYRMSRGHRFYIFETDHCRIGILVCYDVEFPEAARAMADAGAEILFVPSCTDERQGYCRVRYCAQARAIENQCYVALTGTVGSLPEAPYMAANYAQAAILTPSDYYFPRDGVAAEGLAGQEQLIVSDVDLGLLDEQLVAGSVLPLHDVIDDAYDQVVYVVDDGAGPAPLGASPGSGEAG